jgi:hypothetical protein
MWPPWRLTTRLTARPMPVPCQELRRTVQLLMKQLVDVSHVSRHRCLYKIDRQTGMVRLTNADFSLRLCPVNFHAFASRFSMRTQEIIAMPVVFIFTVTLTFRSGSRVRHSCSSLCAIRDRVYRCSCSRETRDRDSKSSINCPICATPA